MDNFRNFLRNWHQLYGRHDLPWRHTTDPYCILVSELMLQQTQVGRVIPKYEAFLKQFPTVDALSRAKLADVLIAWQGLGYNRRAKYLHQAAKLVTENGGVFPTTQQEMQTLPGIGPYTAGAVAAFSFNQPVILIETNIRTVFLYHFFPNQSEVSDSELLPLIEATLDLDNPREWYWALMDYGSYLKSVLPNPTRRSKTYSKQSTFKGSKRQVRGEIIRTLAQHPLLTKRELELAINGKQEYLQPALTALVAEGLVSEKSGTYSLDTTRS